MEPTGHTCRDCNTWVPFDSPHTCPARLVTPAIAPPSRPFACPACDARGKRLPAGVYGYIASPPLEPCVACAGTGIVWSK